MNRRIAGTAALYFLSLAIAAYAVLVYGFSPLGSAVNDQMGATFRAHPVGIYAHVFGAAVALALGPFQFSSRLRARWPLLHRTVGRVYLGVGVLIGGLGGLFMAFHAYGGPAARLGFGGLALAWLFTGARAFLSVRARDIPAHRRWMIRNFALTFAAVTLRLYLPLGGALGVPFETAYPVVAWVCWLPNLLAAELLFNRTPIPGPRAA